MPWGRQGWMRMMVGSVRRGLSSSASALAGTICALSSGAGRAGVAVVRSSGEHAVAKAHELGVPHGIKPRMATRCTLQRGGTGRVIDDALVLFFPGPRSYTGEDVVEYHVHGGRAVVSSLLDALTTDAHQHRMAEPGEFTKRAVLHGKLDAMQVQGLSDLLQADTDAQRRQALQLYRGDHRNLYESWRAELVRCQAHVDALIDWGEDNNFGERDADVQAVVRARAGAVARAVGIHLDDGHRGEMVRDGICVALVGPPNSGKSSLLNVLSARDAALVSATPGTTRDVIEVGLHLGGYAVRVLDTAGLRQHPVPLKKECSPTSQLPPPLQQQQQQQQQEQQQQQHEEHHGQVEQAKHGHEAVEDAVAAAQQHDELERMGMARTTARADEAAVLLLVLDHTAIDNYSDADWDAFVGPLWSNRGATVCVVHNKMDLVDKNNQSSSKTMADKAPARVPPKLASRLPDPSVVHHVWISCATKEGVDGLMQTLQQLVAARMAGPGDAASANEPLLVTNARYRQHLAECADHLAAALAEAEPADGLPDMVVLAEHIRGAVRCIGLVTGRVDPEEILSVIYSEFCIGK